MRWRITVRWQPASACETGCVAKKIPFLYERDDFGDLLRIVADRMSLNPVFGLG